MSTKVLYRLADVLRWIIGLLFIVSGLFKTIDPFGFYERAMPFLVTVPAGLIESAAPVLKYVPLLGPIEMVLGIALITGFSFLISACGLLVLIVGFILMLIRGVLLQMDVKCGCFGRMFEKSASVSLILDLILLIALLFVVALHFVRKTPKWDTRLGFVLVTALASFGVCLFLYLPHWKTLPKHDMRPGQSVAGLDLGLEGLDLSEGAYFLDIMLPVCKHCAEAAPELNRLHGAGIAPVIGMSSDSYSIEETNKFRHATGATFPIARLPAHQHFRLRWKTALPRLVLIKDGIVLKEWPHESGDSRLRQIATESRDLLTTPPVEK